MEKEILEKWKKIYSFAQLIAAYEPWELFEEENTFALVPKGTRNEHYFSFLTKSSGQCGIAIYPSGNAYVAAHSRLHGGNSKREPLDAVILLWGDREDVSKENYGLSNLWNSNSVAGVHGCIFKSIAWDMSPGKYRSRIWTGCWMIWAICG